MIMKQIETGISEHRFLERLESLCRKKERFDKGYEDKDTFVIKRKNNRFCLLKHYATVGKRHGYAVDCLYGKYYTNEDGHVVIDYRLGKCSTYRIPFFVAIVFGTILLISILCDMLASKSFNWNDFAVSILLWIIGLGGALIRSKKERKALEEHLLTICNK